MMVATLAVAIGAWAATEKVGGYTWTYQINGDTAEIYGYWQGARSTSALFCACIGRRGVVSFVTFHLNGLSWP